MVSFLVQQKLQSIISNINNTYIEDLASCTTHLHLYLNWQLYSSFLTCFHQGSAGSWLAGAQCTGFASHWGHLDDPPAPLMLGLVLWSNCLWWDTGPEILGDTEEWYFFDGCEVNLLIMASHSGLQGRHILNTIKHTENRPTTFSQQNVPLP